MEPIQKHLKGIAGLEEILSSIKPDEYILTETEEQEAISHAIISARMHLAWRMEQINCNENEILAKIKSTDWDLEINKDEVLKQANSNKHASIWEKQQREKEKSEHAEKIKWIIEKCDAKYFYRLMAGTSKNKYGKDLIFDEQTKSLITAVCFFMGNDKRFESELGYDKTKGLLLRGVSGLGKSHVIKCIANNELTPVTIVSMLDIAVQIKTDGVFNLNTPDGNRIYIDDVGTEEAEVNHYGTKTNWFKEFIEMYHFKYPLGFNRLIISTNNSFEQLEQKYGFRVRSRIREMFNVIDVKGIDLRK